ncbi:unnamed protein product [Adineta ricciae]|uniref:Uncharacterized protein n=1 Tax=Adineta ricciae TaxID=249248 RepID=A0A815FI33_ADIRI|nr:unnamed protein product [Adineta ricciae]
MFIFVNESSANRRYFIKTNLFITHNANKFSIYDSSETNLLYRIKSLYSWTQKLQIIKQSSEEEVVGELKWKFTLGQQKANFTVHDPDSNQWINGNIQKKFCFLCGKYFIRWNEQDIRIEKKGILSATLFIDDKRNQTLARLEKRPFALFKTTEYDLEIISNDFPDAIYFVGFAFHVLSSRRSGKG